MGCRVHDRRTEDSGRRVVAPHKGAFHIGQSSKMPHLRMWAWVLFSLFPLALRLLLELHPPFPHLFHQLWHNGVTQGWGRQLMGLLRPLPQCLIITQPHGLAIPVPWKPQAHFCLLASACGASLCHSGSVQRSLHQKAFLSHQYEVILAIPDRPSLDSYP